MTVYYRGYAGEEKTLSGIVYLHNLDKRITVAISKDGTEFSLLIERIDSVYYLDQEEMT